jgi:phosphoserine phosphatase RsbU/P
MNLLLVDGLSWPSISFAILIAALLVAAYVLGRRLRSRRMLVQRIAELEALSAAGRSLVASELDVTALCKLIAQEAGQVIDNSTFQVGLFEDNFYQITYWTIDHEEQPTPRTFDLNEHPGLVGWIRQSQQPLLVYDFRKEMEQLPAKPRYISHAPPQSAIFIPLVSGEQTIGIIAAQSSQPNRFTEDDLRRLMILANQAAAAIANAQLYQQERERAWITTAQLQVAEAINRSQNLDEIITAVTRLTPMLTGVKVCGLMLWQEEFEQYVGAALYHGEQDESEQFSQLQLQIGDWPALDAVHVGQEILSTRRLHPWFKKVVLADQLTIVPINTKSQIVGVILVSDCETDGPNPLTQASNHRRHEELLQNIAEQTAQAIEIAQLRVAQQEEAWVNTALLQVAEAVNSLIDLNEILDTIIRLVPMLVGAKSAIILIWDESRGIFMPGPSHGINEMGRGLLETLEVDRDEMTTLAQKSARVLSPTATYYTMQLPHWLEMVLGQSQAHAFPLNARGRLVGIMVAALADNHNRSLSPRRLNILNGIAHQAATAVVNNHLYQEAAERQRLEQELNVAREIQASLIPQQAPDIPGCSVAGYWQAARQVSGDFYDFLPLDNNCWGIVVADVADKGVPAALFMALSRTILRAVAFTRTDPARVLMRVNELICNDAQSDLFVTMFYAIWQPAAGQLIYANGGHNPPLLLHRNGKHQMLHGNGMALGVLPHIRIEPVTVSLRKDDTVIFYTDGVTEAINEDFDEFGMNRLLMAATSAKKGSAYDIVEAITRGVSQHAGDTPQFDDITLVVMKRNQ